MDMTSADVCISRHYLPKSTEQRVEISGSFESCVKCAHQICQVLQKKPTLTSEEVVYYVPLVNKRPFHNKKRKDGETDTRNSPPEKRALLEPSDSTSCEGTESRNSPEK